MEKGSVLFPGVQKHLHPERSIRDSIPLRWSLKCDNPLNGYYIIIIISAGSGRGSNRYSPLNYPAGIFNIPLKRYSPELFLYEREI
jgi:hypothetical protein